MARNHKEIVDITDLSKYIDKFVEEEFEQKIEVVNNFDQETIDISGYDESLVSSQYSITFVEGLKSIRVPSEYFTNHIRNKNRTSILHDKIFNLLSLENRAVEESQIPIDLSDEVKNDRLIDSSTPIKRRRYSRILSEINVELDETILKTSYKNEYLSGFESSIAGDILRIYYQKNEETNNINIVLLDVHHLLATSLENYRREYRVVKDYNCCIRKLLL